MVNGLSATLHISDTSFSSSDDISKSNFLSNVAILSLELIILFFLQQILYLTSYSGGSDEETGNYIVLLKSDDEINFSEPIAAVYKEYSRCFDECIWIDPKGRLWLIWSVMPKITELMPMYSRDGYNFSRPNRESIINASLCKGSWDRGYVQSVGGTLIIHGDELWIYYAAFGGDEKLKHRQPWTLNGMYSNGATGLAKLRRDGFVSMNGKGTLTTKKMTFSNKCDMYVNIDGTVSAEILSPGGKLLAKSGVFSGDSTKAKLNFNGFDISSLNGEVFKIKFNVDGKLYSFGFSDENGDFGGAHAAGVCD